MVTWWHFEFGGVYVAFFCVGISNEFPIIVEMLIHFLFDENGALLGQ
jgi:hypothetical protein